jgi:rubrerythrin
MSVSDDLSNLYTSLSLEIAAVARYQDHRERTDDPSFFSLIEGLMRNEEGHEDELAKNIERLGGDPGKASTLPGPTLPTMIYDGDQIRGQKTNMAMFRADLAFETEATRIYHEFFSAATDEGAKQIFKELVRAERGHMNGLKKLIVAVEGGTHEVRFFCPICGWAIEFGTEPESGAEARCPICAGLFAIGESDGDFTLIRK